jgi:molybdopterin-guanine dinucleotide biosynthesis protein A
MVKMQSNKIFLENLTTVVLAGGKSRRFGSQKSAARLRNKSLLEISLEIALKISNQVLVIRGQEKIPLPRNIKSFPDIIFNKGPLGGIYSALSFSETDYIAILPVDMPLLCSEIYEYLITNFQFDKPIAAVSRKGLEPLVSIWPQKHLKLVENLIKQNNLSIWNCIEESKAIKINFSKLYPEISDKCFYNINTKEDLKSLIKDNFS